MYLLYLHLLCKRGQSPDSERLQPPQGSSLTAHSTTFIVSHPIGESGKTYTLSWYQINKIFCCSELLCFLFLSPALFLSFLWCSNGQTLVHVPVEEPQNVTSCQKPYEEEHTPHWVCILYGHVYESVSEFLFILYIHCQISDSTHYHPPKYLLLYFIFLTVDILECSYKTCRSSTYISVCACRCVCVWTVCHQVCTALVDAEPNVWSRFVPSASSHPELIGFMFQRVCMNEASTIRSPLA